MTHPILSQLGGSKFIAMTGAKNFVKDGDSMLQFDIGRGATNKANKVRITLNANDLYEVEFFKWNARKLDLSTVGKVSDVYADQLQEVFTNHTGFDTHL